MHTCTPAHLHTCTPAHMHTCLVITWWKKSTSYRTNNDEETLGYTDEPPDTLEEKHGHLQQVTTSELTDTTVPGTAKITYPVIIWTYGYRYHRLTKHLVKPQSKGHSESQMAQAQLTPNQTLRVEWVPQPSLLTISRILGPKGGRYCVFKHCFEERCTYNTMRDHIMHHHAFREQMMAHDKNYENCCENAKHFRNAQMKCHGCQILACQACKRRWIHRFQLCVNAPANLRHLISKVWMTTEVYIFNDDQDWDMDPSEEWKIVKTKVKSDFSETGMHMNFKNLTKGLKTVIWSRSK